MTTAIALCLQNKTAAEIYMSGLDEILEKIRKEATAETFDISTKTGREAMASNAYKVARSKTLIDDMGKKLGEDARKTLDAINADRKKAVDYLNALKDEVRAPLTALENAEKEAREKILREKQEKEQAELAKLREEKAARDQAERDAAIAKEAADRATREAEAKAAAELQAAQRAVQQLEAERAREAAKAKAEAEADAVRQADKEHRTKINREALADLIAATSLDKEAGIGVIKAIAQGHLRHVTIRY